MEAALLGGDEWRVCAAARGAVQAQWTVNSEQWTVDSGQRSGTDCDRIIPCLFWPLARSPIGDRDRTGPDRTDSLQPIPALLAFSRLHTRCASSVLPSFLHRLLSPAVVQPASSAPSFTPRLCSSYGWHGRLRVFDVAAHRCRRRHPRNGQRGEQRGGRWRALSHGFVQAVRARPQATQPALVSAHTRSQVH